MRGRQRKRQNPIPKWGPEGSDQVGSVPASSEGRPSVGETSKEAATPGVSVKRLASSHLHKAGAPMPSPFGEMP